MVTMVKWEIIWEKLTRLTLTCSSVTTHLFSLALAIAGYYSNTATFCSGWHWLNLHNKNGLNNCTAKNILRWSWQRERQRCGMLASLIELILIPLQSLTQNTYPYPMGRGKLKIQTIRPILGIVRC